jgi:hypothetical protein
MSASGEVDATGNSTVSVKRYMMTSRELELRFT